MKHDKLFSTHVYLFDNVVDTNSLLQIRKDITSSYNQTTKNWQSKSNLHKNVSFHGESYNFGPESHQNFSVRELVESMSKHWEKVKWNDISNNQKIEAYESNLLKLNCDKALHHLKWRPVLDFKSTVEMTANWYKSFYEEDKNNNQITSKQIIDYTQKAKEKGLAWAK